MPDVGALNLTIKSNATAATNGLNNLAGALTNVKTAVGKGLGLGTVGRQVTSLAKTINEAKGTSTVVKNLASLFNAISNFSKLKSVKIDVQPFADLKTALGDGISLGKAGEQMLKMREAMEGEWTADGAVNSMSRVAAAASVFKAEGTSKTLTDVASAMNKYASAAKAMQKSGILEMHGGGLSSAGEAGRLMKVNLGQFGNGIEKETGPVYEQMKIDLDAIARDSAFDKMKSSIDDCFGSVENLDSGVQQVQKSIENTTAGAGQYSENINRALDFSKFDVSKLPMDRIGEKLSEAGQQVQMFKDTVQTTEESTNSIILYNENLATSWENICARMAESGRLVTFASVEETAKFLGMAVDDVKKRLQETYNMVYEGKQQGSIFSSLEQAAKLLGMTVEEVNKELQKTYEMVYGKSLDSGFKDATESIKESTQAAKTFKESVAESTESVVDNERKLDLLIQKANIIESQASRRINVLMEKGRDPDRDKTLVNYKLQLMGLYDQIKKLEDVEDRKSFAKSTLDWSEQSSSIDAYRMKLQALQDQLEEGIKTGLWDEGKVANAMIQIDQLKAKLQKLSEEQAGQALLISSEEATKAADNFLEANNEISILKMQLEELKQRMGQGIINGTMDSVELSRLAQKIRSVTEQIQEMEETTKRSGGVFTRFVEGAGSAFGKLKNILKETFPFLTKVNHQFGRIMMRRAITAVIRSITRAFKEGVENVYKYSEAIGSSFAPALDSAKSMITQFKNSIGAAVAPLIQALIPVFNQIVSAAIQVINVINQLFALLGGQSSWTRALPATTKAFEDTKKAASGAGGAVKDMLADFDELTVLDQNSGGGGGGAATAAAEAYEDMFEQVGEFDEKIREIVDFAKDAIEWIKDNMDLVLGIVGAIGLAILGWKISKAFGGALETLGQIIAGVGLVTLGVLLDFDFGKAVGSSIVSGKALSWGSIVEGVAGFVAAGIGGYMMFGGVGAAVGISITLYAFVAGVIAGWEDEKDKLKWGDTSLTPEQVQDYVKSQFSFDVDMEIKIIGGKLENARAAKAHLSQEIYEFSESLYKIRIGVDTSPEAIEKAKDQMGEIIKALNEATTATENLVTAYLQVMPYDQKSEDNAVARIFSADSQLNEYFEGLGKQAAELYDKGMRTGWAEGEQEQILALMEHMNNIFAGAELGRAGDTLIVSSKMKLKDMTRDTAEDILKAQKEKIDTYKSTMKQATEEASEELLYYARLADAAGLMDKESGRALGDIYREQANFLVDGFEDAYEIKLAESKQTMKKDWIAALNDVYNADYYKVIKQARYNFEEDLKKAFIKQKDEGKTKNVILQYLEKVLDVGITKDAADLFEITGWELLANNAKEQFFDTVYKALGVDSVRMLKDALNLPASELIQISGWQKFSIDQKLLFVQALINAYGAPEALAAAKNAGIDVAEMIQAGLDSKDPDVQRTAKELSDTIRNEVEKIDPTIDVNANLAVQVEALVNIAPQVQNGVIGAVKSTVTTTTAAVKNIFEKLGSAVKKIQGRANGAYGIPNGDLFIANEAGPELVGTIGGKTSVANQGQIIEGISSGVERANEEQNALLREQNNLLRRLLEKDATVRIGASAALGRTVKQSLDMYGGMTGG